MMMADGGGRGRCRERSVSASYGVDVVAANNSRIAFDC